MVMVMVMLRAALLSSLFLVFSGCSFQENKCDILMPLYNEEMMALLENDFKKAGIIFVHQGDGRICVSKSDANQSRSLLNTFHQRHLPKDYSKSLPPEMHSRVIARLRSSGIAYTNISVEGKEYVVWGKEHDDKVRSIIRRAEKQAADEWRRKMSEKHGGTIHQ